MDDNCYAGRPIRGEPDKGSRQRPDATHSVGDARGRIDAGVPVAEGAVENGKRDNDRAYRSPVFLGEVRPGSSRGGVPLDIGDAPAVHTGKGGQRVEQADDDGAKDDGARNVALWIMRFFAQGGRGFKADKGQEGKDQALEDAGQATKPALCAISEGEGLQVVMRSD